MISIFYVHLLLFFFNDTATTEIYTLSLHDALPISPAGPSRNRRLPTERPRRGGRSPPRARDRPAAASASARPHPRHRPSRPDRKSTRLNSSHANISYAVFCLKKKITEIILSMQYIT